MSAGPPSSSPRGAGPGTGWISRENGVLLSICLLLVAVLFAIAFTGQGRTARDKWKDLLTAMADEQEAAVEAYVARATSNAGVVARFPAVRELLESGAGGREAEAESHLHSVLEGARAGWELVSLTVVGVDLLPRAHAGLELPPEAYAAVSRGGRPKKVGFFDTPGGKRLVLAAPVHPDAGGEGLGWVFLVDDPTHTLWQTLRREPAASRTGESLLVEREGGRPVFLSPLRHVARGTRPPDRFIADEGLAARHALEGREAFGSYRDYRGKRVFAAVRRIDSTGWGLVVKIDREEALAGLTQNHVWAGFALLSLAFAFVAAYRSVRSAGRLRIAAELQKRDERHRRVLAQVRDAVVWVRPGDGRILEANRAAEELWGYTREELLRMAFADLRPEGEDEEARSQMVAARSGGVLYRARKRRKDGRVVPVEVSARTVDLDGEDVLISVVRDVSESEAALERIQLLNRLLRTIGVVGQVLVEGSDRETVLRRTCQEIVAAGGFAGACIAVPGEGGRLVQAASAGWTEGQLCVGGMGGEGKPPVRGPTEAAYVEGRTVVVEDWEIDPGVGPLREASRRRGFRSSAACPVRCDEATGGVLSLYAVPPGAFVPDVVLLLEELARTLGLALDLIGAEERRRSAEGALAASEARYRTLFEDNPAPMWVFDIETLRFLAVNDAAVSLYGYTREELLGRSIRDLRPPEDIAALEEDVRAPRSGVRASGPWRERRKDGRQLLVEIVSHDVPFEGRSARLVLANDVTERLRTEEKIRAFFDSGMVGAITGDVYGSVQVANDEFLRIVGNGRAALEAGRLRWTDLTPGEFRPLDAERIAEAREKGVCAPFEKELLKSDGTRVPVLVGYAVVGEAREELVAFVLDQTLRKAAEEDVRRLNAGLEERVEQRTAELVAKTKELEGFAYSISHDLRAPVRAIDGFSALLGEEHSAALDDEGKRLVSVVRDNARRMGRLIDDLLAFSRAGRHDLRRSHVDVTALVRDVLVEVLPESERERSDVTVGELPSLQADPALLRQVFVNLLANAVKFSATRSRRRIEVRGRREGGRVVYDVIDNGVGFDMRYADKLFGVFQRLHGREFEGTGVGLALVERIVARHGGSIRAEGALDRGAAFTISLPIE